MADLDPLLALARSSDPAERAAAGRALAAFVGSAAADAALIALLTDQYNTLPTLETAEALLERRDAAGLRIVAVALAAADEDATTHTLDALDNVTQTQEEYVDLLARCNGLLADTDPAVRTGGVTLVGWFDRA